jgi:O-glycosyl hydrolase
MEKIAVMMGGLMKKYIFVSVIFLAMLAGCAASDDDSSFVQGNTQTEDKGNDDNSNNNGTTNPPVTPYKISVWRASHDPIDAIPVLLMAGTDTPELIKDDNDLTTNYYKGDKLSKASIKVSPNKTYQSMLGMGGSFDHSTCWNLKKFGIGSTRWKETIAFMFGGQYKIPGENPEAGMGQSLARLCIGTSDFIPDDQDWYSYDDIPAGETDFGLEHFSIDRDREYVLPAIKYAKLVNPGLKFFASPWSPPAWMKTNGELSGSTNPDGTKLIASTEIYDAYARYLVKFIRAYKAEGIPIYAITFQNEPNAVNTAYPTCKWTAEDERIFIRHFLGPLFEIEGLNTKIWCLDHNWNMLDFPRAILGDSLTSKYVDGTAFHSYSGNVKSQSVIHDEYPDKNVFFSERSYYRTKGATEIIGILRNWSCSYNFWVQILDKKGEPNKGPFSATPTCMEMIDTGNDSFKVSYKFDFNMYSLFMKFIRPGAVRLDSTDELDNVAFKNPDGTIVIVVANNNLFPKDFSCVIGNRIFSDTIDAFTVAAYQCREMK